jgi:hypothetical protein
MMPQTACFRTNTPRHKVKQGVASVAKVTREFLMPDGSVKQESELTPKERQSMAQKIMDLFIVPLAYDAVMRDLENNSAGT